MPTKPESNYQFFFQMYSSVFSPTNFVLQSLPDKNLESLSKVCRTFSLATLKNIFPPSSHFTRSGNTSNVTSSAYVTEYIGKYFNIFHSKNSIEDMTPNPKTIKSNWANPDTFFDLSRSNTSNTTMYKIVPPAIPCNTATDT